MRDCKFPSKTKRLCTSVETLTVEKTFTTGIATSKENVNPELMGGLMQGEPTSTEEWKEGAGG